MYTSIDPNELQSLGKGTRVVLDTSWAMAYVGSVNPNRYCGGNFTAPPKVIAECIDQGISPRFLEDVRKVSISYDGQSVKRERKIIRSLERHSAKYLAYSAALDCVEEFLYFARRVNQKGFLTLKSVQKEDPRWLGKEQRYVRKYFDFACERQKQSSKEHLIRHGMIHSYASSPLYFNDLKRKFIARDFGSGGEEQAKYFLTKQRKLSEADLSVLLIAGIIGTNPVIATSDHQIIEIADLRRRVSSNYLESIVD
ncbi:hypothetical protein HOC01_03265 [archaeon]|jgi:hypothetical protein|nr:hypothetical protein [archaeon]MBT6698091.1 hypothetical protein [archaeon]